MSAPIPLRPERLHLADVLAKLEGVRAGSGGQYEAKCPAHEDERPSLGAREGDDGKILLHCQAGCTLADIARSLGISTTQLFPDSGPRPLNGARRKAPVPVPTKKSPATPPLTDADVDRMAAALAADPDAWRHVTETLRLDADVVRQERIGLHVTAGRRWIAYPYRSGGAWTFANCRSLDGERGFHRFPAGQPTTLFRGDSLEPGGTAIVTEGERDALAALTMLLDVELGGTAGASVVAIPGADQWRRAVEQLRAQARVYVALDADDAGDKAAAKLMEALGPIAVRLRPSAAKDFGDLLAAHGPDGALRLVLDAAKEAKPEATGLLSRRPCDVARLREREHLQFVPLAKLPEDHGMGEMFDKITGGGLAPGSLVGIGAAGTGAGKTAILMQVLDGLALRSAIAAEDHEATVPLTPVAIFSEMAADDLEVRTLGRLLDVPGTVFAAGRSARRWHKWTWVEDQFNRAAALMEPGATYHRIAAWQRYTRAGSHAGPSFVRDVEAAVGAWVEEIVTRYPGREIVPVLAIDPVNSFLPLDGRSEVETLGELTALLDELADRRRWICAFTAETNKTSAVAAGNGNTSGTAAAVFRGTMQLLHRCDLALVLEAGEPDPDGVRPVTITFDKNRTGRTGVATSYRWHTRTGLRFVAETVEEHEGRRVTDTSFPSPESLEALCALVERLQAAGEKATNTKVRDHHEALRVPFRDVSRLIFEAVERNLLRRTGEKTRGGGDGPLAPVEGWRERVAWREVPAPNTEPVQTGANP